MYNWIYAKIRNIFLHTLFTNWNYTFLAQSSKKLKKSQVLFIVQQREWHIKLNNKLNFLKKPNHDFESSSECLKCQKIIGGKTLSRYTFYIYTTFAVSIYNRRICCFSLLFFSTFFFTNEPNIIQVGFMCILNGNEKKGFINKIQTNKKNK